MANEITVASKMDWTSVSGEKMSATVSIKHSQVGTIAMQNVQAIGVTSEAIFLGDITDPAYILFENVGANVINISIINPAVAATSTILLNPGGASYVEGVATAYYAIATTAITNLQVTAIQR